MLYLSFRGQCLHFTSCFSSQSCKDIAQTLYDCVKQTECMKNGGDFRACLKDREQTPDCQVFRNAYFECKRGSLDMRNRIKGQKVY